MLWDARIQAHGVTCEAVGSKRRSWRETGGKLEGSWLTGLLKLESHLLTHLAPCRDTAYLVQHLLGVLPQLKLEAC